MIDPVDIDLSRYLDERERQEYPEDEDAKLDWQLRRREANEQVNEVIRPYLNWVWMGK